MTIGIDFDGDGVLDCQTEIASVVPHVRRIITSMAVTAASVSALLMGLVDSF